MISEKNLLNDIFCMLYLELANDFMVQNDCITVNISSSESIIISAKKVA